MARPSAHDTNETMALLRTSPPSVLPMGELMALTIVVLLMVVL